MLIFNKLSVLSILLLLTVLFLFGLLLLKKRINFTPQPKKDNKTHVSSSLFANDRNILYIDFEDFEANGSITDKMAYSGKHACIVEGKNSFSPIIKKKIGDIGKSYMVKAGLSAYVFAAPENFDRLTARLVIAITDENNNNLLWDGVAITHEFFKPNEWIKIYGTVDLDTSLFSDEHHVNIYLWNDSKTKLLIDDIFVVFGKDAPLAGDTSYCYAKENGIGLPPFNYPPFKIRYINKENVSNDNLLFLSDVQKNLHETSLNKAVIAGNFFNTANKLDKIIYKLGNSLYALAYCKTNKNFDNFVIDISNDLIHNWDNSIKIKGSFSQAAGEEIILVDNNKNDILLLTFSSATTACASDKPIKCQAKKYPFSYFSNKDMMPSAFHAIPLTKNKDGLLVFYGNGNFAIYNFDNNWQKVRHFENETYFNSQSQKSLILTGNFLDGNSHKLILKIFNDGKKKHELFLYNSSKKALQSMGTQKTIGLDTLHADAKYYVIKQGANKDLLLFHEHQSRFDMKLLSFNDSSFTILNSIDFAGFKKDYNPKYYEVMGIIAGQFTDADYTSIISVCTNCKDNKFDGIHCLEYENDERLPDAVHIYTFR